MAIKKIFEENSQKFHSKIDKCFARGLQVLNLVNNLVDELLNSHKNDVDDEVIKICNKIQRVLNIGFTNQRSCENLCEKHRDHTQITVDILYQAATYDSLTHLRNRAKLKDDGLELINSKKPFSVVYLDLDYFKDVNDTYGHDVGDFVLQEFAKLLTIYFSKGNNTVYRLGGDEFVICSTDSSDTILENIKNLKTILCIKPISYFNENKDIVLLDILELSFGLTYSKEDIRFDDTLTEQVDMRGNTYEEKKFRGIVKSSEIRMRKNKKERKKQR